MNNIYEFAEQAAEHAVLNPSDEILQSESGDVLVQIPKAFIDKFAEKIVQECIGCCEQVISDPVPKSVDTWLNGGLQCINEIKKHFGIDNA